MFKSFFYNKNNLFNNSKEEEELYSNTEPAHKFVSSFEIEKEKEFFPRIMSQKQAIIHTDHGSYEPSNNNIVSTSNFIYDTYSSVMEEPDPLHQNKKIIYSKIQNKENIKIEEPDKINLNANLNTNSLQKCMNTFMFNSKEKMKMENFKKYNFSYNRNPLMNLYSVSINYNSHRDNTNILSNRNIDNPNDQNNGKNVKIKATKNLKAVMLNKSTNKKLLAIHQHPIIFPFSNNNPSRQENNRTEFSPKNHFQPSIIQYQYNRSKLKIGKQKLTNSSNNIKKVETKAYPITKNVYLSTNNYFNSKKINNKDENYIYKFPNKLLANSKSTNSFTFNSTRSFKFPKEAALSNSIEKTSRLPKNYKNNLNEFVENRLISKESEIISPLKINKKIKLKAIFNSKLSEGSENRHFVNFQK